MLILGLTGSLGMGKSTAAAHLRELGLPVFDADAEVHRLYATTAVPLIEAAFLGTTREGKVDRNALSAALLAAPRRFPELEKIVHPLVRASERAFLQGEAASGTGIAVLEIPLLFETNANDLVDATIVVSAPAKVQRQRLLQRADLDEKKIDSLLARQMPDAEKRRRADFVVDTGVSIEASNASLDAIIARLRTWRGTAYQRCWA
jgi:dephospho-CoA kinase